MMKALGFGGLVALALAALAVGGCRDEIPATEEQQAEQDVVSLLGANADRFEYEIGDHGGSLTFATIAEPLTFNLALATDAGLAGALGYLFEGLTDISWLTGEPQPNLAHTWDVSSDGLTWTFYLRRDVRWHDGEPFTARDVEFTFNEIIYNEEISTPDRAAFTFRLLNDASQWQEAPMTVTAIDEYTVQCVLPVSFAPFLRSMAQPIFPQHILQPHVDAGTFGEVWDIGTDPAEIIGTGPFLIEQYVAEERIVFRRNPDYWMRDAEGGRLPYLDRIVQLIVPDLETELEAFLDGTADIHGVRGVEHAELAPLQEDANFTIHRRGPTFGSTFLSFNQNRGTNPDSGEPYVSDERLHWFTNTAFRQAVAHSIDTDAIIQQVQFGFGYPQRTQISPAAGRLPQPQRRHVRVRPQPRQRNPRRTGLDRSRRRRIPRGRSRQPDRVHLGHQHPEQRARAGHGDHPRGPDGVGARRRLPADRLRRVGRAVDRLIRLGRDGDRLHRRA